MAKSHAAPSIPDFLQRRLTKFEAELWQAVGKIDRDAVQLDVGADDGRNILVVGSPAALALLGLGLLNHAFVAVPQAKKLGLEPDDSGIYWSKNTLVLDTPYKGREVFLGWGVNEQLPQTKVGTTGTRGRKVLLYFVVAPLAAILFLPWVIGLIEMLNWFVPGTP